MTALEVLCLKPLPIELGFFFLYYWLQIHFSNDSKIETNFSNDQIGYR